MQGFAPSEKSSRTDDAQHAHFPTSQAAALSRRRTLWFALGVLVLSRLLIVLLADPLPGDDGNRYLREAQNLWTHGVFSDHAKDVMPSAHDLPLFPLLLTGMIALCKIPWIAAKAASAVNCMFFGVAAMGVHALCKRLTGDAATALVAVIIFGCFPGSYPYSVYYMPESLFVALFVWSIVFFIDDLQKTRPLYALAAYLLWGASVLAKPISMFFGLVFAAASIVHARMHAQDITRRIIVTMLALALGGSILVPWLVRNERVFGVVGLSSITGTNPFYMNYRFMLEDMGVQSPSAVVNAQEVDVLASLPVALQNPMGRAAALGAFAKKAIVRNWPHYLRTVMRRHPSLYTSTGAVDTLRLFGDAPGIAALEQGLTNHAAVRAAPLRVVVLIASSWLLLAFFYAAAAMGLAKLAHRRQWLALATLLGTLVYFAALIGPVTSARYRFVMLPALAIAAAIGLQRGAERMKTVAR